MCWGWGKKRQKEKQTTPNSDVTLYYIHVKTMSHERLHYKLSGKQVDFITVCNQHIKWHAEKVRDQSSAT